MGYHNLHAGDDFMDTLDKLNAAAAGARRVHPCKAKAKARGWTHAALAKLWGVDRSTATRMLDNCNRRTAILVDGLDDLGGND